MWGIHSSNFFSKSSEKKEISFRQTPPPSPYTYSLYIGESKQTPQRRRHKKVKKKKKNINEPIHCSIRRDYRSLPELSLIMGSSTLKRKYKCLIMETFNKFSARVFFTLAHTSSWMTMSLKRALFFSPLHWCFSLRFFFLTFSSSVEP